jgi:hypothetical protein
MTYAALLAVTLRLEPRRVQAMIGTQGEDVRATDPAGFAVARGGLG